MLCREHVRDVLALMAVFIVVAAAWLAAWSPFGEMPPIWSRDGQLGYNGLGSKSCCLARFDLVGRDGYFPGHFWIHQPAWWPPIGPFEIITPEGRWTIEGRTQIDRIKTQDHHGTLIRVPPRPPVIRTPPPDSNGLRGSFPPDLPTHLTTTGEPT